MKNVSALVAVAVLVALPAGTAGAEKKAAGTPTGTISLGITSEKTIKAVYALNRDIPPRKNKVQVKRFKAHFDAEKKRYGIKNLAPGAYDIEIVFDDAALAGVDLSLKEPDGKQPDEKGKKKIRKFVRDQKAFMDEHTILYMEGDSKRVRVLVDQLRKNKTSYTKRKKPFVIWRVETWKFVKTYGVWERDGDGTKIILREMIAAEDFDKMTYLFDPKLGGIAVEAGKTSTIEYRVAKELKGCRGRILGKVSADDAAAGDPKGD